MEGLDHITLYVGLTTSQVESILAGGMALPLESSQRFGLRVRKDEAIQRSHDFMEWERLHVNPEVGEFSHKDFTIGTIKVSAIGYLQKSLGGILERTKPTEFRWKGGLQHKEVLSDGRVLYEFINYERIL